MPRWYFLLSIGFAAGACRAAIGVDELSFSDEAPDASASGMVGNQGGSPLSSSSGDISQGGSNNPSGGSGGAGGTSEPLMVSCGNQSCLVDSTHACCWNLLAQEGQCVTGSSGQDGCDAQKGLAHITCQTSDDCPAGQSCCATETTIAQTSFYSSSSCEILCLYPNVVLCDQLGEMEPGCPPAFINGMLYPTACQPIMTLPPGYLVCEPL